MLSHVSRCRVAVLAFSLQRVSLQLRRLGVVVFIMAALRAVLPLFIIWLAEGVVELSDRLSAGASSVLNTAGQGESLAFSYFSAPFCLEYDYTMQLHFHSTKSGGHGMAAKVRAYMGEF